MLLPFLYSYTEAPVDASSINRIIFDEPFKKLAKILFPLGVNLSPQTDIIV